MSESAEFELPTQEDFRSRGKAASSARTTQ